MVVSKDEFQRALTEINESYAALISRIQELENKVAELEKPKANTRAKTTKAA